MSFIATFIMTSRTFRMDKINWRCTIFVIEKIGHTLEKNDPILSNFTSSTGLSGIYKQKRARNSKIGHAKSVKIHHFQGLLYINSRNLFNACFLFACLCVYSFNSLLLRLILISRVFYDLIQVDLFIFPFIESSLQQKNCRTKMKLPCCCTVYIFFKDSVRKKGDG